MVYLALLALQIILGLGNRPKAERFAYAMSMWLFGLLAMYLVVNTLYLTGMALCPMQIKINEALDSGKSVITVFTDGTFGPIVSVFKPLDRRQSETNQAFFRLPVYWVPLASGLSRPSSTWIRGSKSRCTAYLCSHYGLTYCHVCFQLAQ